VFKEPTSKGRGEEGIGNVREEEGRGKGKRSRVPHLFNPT